MGRLCTGLLVAGLVWVDRLALSPAQWIALLASMALLVRFGVTWRVLLGVHALLLSVCWGVALSTDTRLLFQSAAYLQRFTWAQFLTELPFRDYVKLQPPFYTFWVSRLPVLWLHQVMQAAVLLPCALLMRDMFGPDARFLLATPLYLLMSTQPGNDVALFVVMVCVLRLIQLDNRIAAALLFGISFMVKPLTVILAPLMVSRLRSSMLLAVGIVVIYYWWSITYFFGAIQWDFLASQLLVQKFFALLRGAGSI